MNNGDLSQEKQRKIESNQREIQRLNDIITELGDKLGRREYEEVLEKKEKLEGEISKLDKKIKNAKSINEGIRRKLESFAKVTYPKEIYKINVPNGSVMRINEAGFYELLAQSNLYFSLLDCPFPDTGLSDAKKEELIKSITGETTIATTDPDVIKKNYKLDPKWELKEPGETPGVVEPTYRSYEWFKRWWNYHANYPLQEMNLATEKEMQDEYPASVEWIDNVNGEEIIFKYRNVVALTKKKGNVKSRADEYLSGSSRKIDYLVPYVTLQQYQPNTFDDVPEIEYRVTLFTNFLAYVNDEVFRSDRLSYNLLLNQNSNILPGESIPAQYTIKPEKWATDNVWDVLCLGSYYTLNSG
ncbi:MAG: hypothetical protein MRECE_25c001, partial [Mycoplasmataceae bacterium CE_OT135]